MGMLTPGVLAVLMLMMRVCGIGQGMIGTVCIVMMMIVMLMSSRMMMMMMMGGGTTPVRGGV